MEHDDDFHMPDGDRTPSDWGWGLASLLIGCTLLLSACNLMVLNILLFRGGLRGIPLDIARPAAVLGVGSVAAIGVCAIVFGLRGWSRATRHKDSPALGVAGAAMASVGVIAWLIAGIDLLAVLEMFR